MRQIQRRRVVLALFTGATLLENGVLVALIVLGIYGPLEFYAVLALVALALLVIFTFLILAGLDRQCRRMLQLARGDQRGLVPVTLPPHVAPLATGSELLLRRTLRRGWILVLFFVLLSFYVLVMPLSIASFLPNDTSAFIFHLFWVLLLVPGSVVALSTNTRLYRSQLIVVNDMGITVQRQHRKAQSVAWHDVVAVFQAGQGQASETAGAFRIITRERALELYPYPDMATNTKKPIIELGEDAATYQARAQQLLATIALRSAPPMKRPPSARAVRFFGVTAEAAPMLPPAHSDMQPDPTQAVADPASLRFTAAVPLRSYNLTRASLLLPLWVIGIEVLLTLLTGRLERFFAAATERGWGIFALVLAGIYGFVLLLALPMAIFRDRITFRRNVPTFLPDETGLTLRTTKRAVKTLPWKDATAWVVTRKKDGKQRYRLYGNNLVLQWDDDSKLYVSGKGTRHERQQAYRQHMHALYATIAARTGLTLREQR